MLLEGTLRRADRLSWCGDSQGPGGQDPSRFQDSRSPAEMQAGVSPWAAMRESLREIVREGPGGISR